MSDLGFTSYIKEVAQSGVHGAANKVERLPLYTFISTLSYLRTQNEWVMLINK